MPSPGWKVKLGYRHHMILETFLVVCFNAHLIYHSFIKGSLKALSTRSMIVNTSRTFVSSSTIQLLSLNPRYYSGSGWVRRLRGAQSCDVRLLAAHHPSHECEAFSQISVCEGGGSTVNISLYLNIYVILTMCRHHVQTNENKL